jgi:hypothetical protein
MTCDLFRQLRTRNSVGRLDENCMGRVLGSMVNGVRKALSGVRLMHDDKVTVTYEVTLEFPPDPDHEVGR